MIKKTTLMLLLIIAAMLALSACRTEQTEQPPVPDISAFVNRPMRYLDPEYIGELESGGLFFINRLDLWLVGDGGTTQEVFEQAQAAIASIGGEIIWASNWNYLIEVPANTEAGLRSLGETLLNNYPHLFDNFFFSRAEMLGHDGIAESVVPGLESGGGTR